MDLSISNSNDYKLVTAVLIKFVMKDVQSGVGK